MVETLKKYQKVLVAALGVIVSAVVASFIGDGVMTFSELVNVVVLGAGTVSVGIAPNIPGSKYVKAALAAVSAVATLLLSVASGGINSAEWAQIVVAVLTAFGVYQLPNTGDTLDRMEANVALQ